jgi:hypothetical protein
LFEQPKIEYSIRSINSLINSINFCKKKYPNLEIKTLIIDDNSKEENLNRIKKLINNYNIKIIPLDHKKFEAKIKKQKSKETFSNLASLLQSFELGYVVGDDLVFFVVDDFLRFGPVFVGMFASSGGIASLFGFVIFLCPPAYPFLSLFDGYPFIFFGIL